jgi:hypothetical protein
LLTRGLLPRFSSGGIMLRFSLVTTALALQLCAFSFTGIFAKAAPPCLTDTQVLINREQEIDLALKAAPIHLRKDATVFVFGKQGYEKVLTGNNGFNCLVNRDGIQNGNNALLPTCWDPEGSRTILPVMLRVGELLAQNKSAAEIKQDIDEGFASGRFHSPAKTGIAYMLAGDIKFDPKSGEVSDAVFPPHYMIYAPGVTNADIGVTSEGLKQTPGLPFVYSGYSGASRTAYIIVPANQGAGHSPH